MKKVICLLLVMVVLFSSCGKTEVTEDLGSFVKEKSFSSDNKYFVTLSHFFNEDKVEIVYIDVRYAHNEKIQGTITVGDMENFKGYCWEDGTHRIWVQTTNDVKCYEYVDFEYRVVEDAVKPDGIISIHD